MKTGFYGPRSRDNARLLLDTAKELGYPAAVVKTTRGGYNAPEDVVQAVLGIADIEEGVNYPAPDEEPTPEVGEDQTEPEKVRPHNGASFKEWSDYAKSLGIEVTEDDKRDGLIEKVDALKEGTD
jgi:hypothetical protein